MSLELAKPDCSVSGYSEMLCAVCSGAGQIEQPTAQAVSRQRLSAVGGAAAVCVCPLHALHLPHAVAGAAVFSAVCTHF
jgi:hypothetical protein